MVVGIVDSGLTDADGEFTGRISPLSRDFAGNGTITDVGGHGTAVAETLAGAKNDAHVLGMAWGATVMALRTDAPGSCATTTADGLPGCTHSTSAMAAAVDYAWRNGARVVNISLGGSGATSDLLAAVSRATAAGTIIVIAAGNVGAGDAPSPSPDALAMTIANPVYSHGLVIIATSVDNTGLVSSFSAGARGQESVSLAALGNMVRTIDNKGTDFYFTGTSFSAPQIAGAAALLAQAFPNLSSAQIVQLLLTTARDAGAAGPDAVYGMGILDVAKAFSPQGALSLAGSTAPVSVGATSTLSAAMGDAAASSAALKAVILDGYGRAFSMDFAGAIARHAPSSGFAQSLLSPVRHMSAAAGPLSLAFSIAPGRQGPEPLALGRSDVARARFLSGTVLARLAARSTVAFGLRTGAQGLADSLAGRGGPSFLVAGNGAGLLAPEMQAASGMAWREQIDRSLALTGGMELGDVARADGAGRLGAAGTAPLDSIGRRDARYQAISLALGWQRGALALDSTLRLVGEQGSALGARFAPAFGAQSARSLFASMGAHLAPLPGLAIGASMQRGWTRAAAGGALIDGGKLVSQSWSADIAGRDILATGDQIGLRIAAPLRVIASRFDLTLPQGWDWQTRTATNGITTLDLVPRGAERDLELSYGRALAGGWLATNIFLRSQAGNVASAPDDRGVAFRWSVGF